MSTNRVTSTETKRIPALASNPFCSSMANGQGMERFGETSGIGKRSSLRDAHCHHPVPGYSDYPGTRSIRAGQLMA